MFAHMTARLGPHQGRLGTAFRGLRAAGCAVLQSVQHLGVEAVIGEVTTMVLHVPQKDLDMLKVRGHIAWASAGVHV